MLELNAPFLSRWLRLLFSREFPMPEVMPLWDAIFAADPSLGIAKWVCMAMLMRIRNKRKCLIYYTKALC